MVDWYDREGRPIDMRKFERLFHDHSYRFLAQEEIDGFRVSTVWLGIDHGWGRGPLQIFETMIFCVSWDAEYLERWSTELEAIEAHEKIVDMIRRGLLTELDERLNARTILQHAL